MLYPSPATRERGPQRKRALFPWPARMRKDRDMPPKIRDVLQQLKDAGWQQVGQTGSHRQFKHPVYPGRVTVAGKPSDDVAPGTLNSILKQAGLKR